MIRRACQTAALPRLERVESRGDVFLPESKSRAESNCMFISCGLSAQRPHSAVANFNFDHIQRARRRTVQNVSRRGIESAFVTWTLESLMLARVIHRTREVRALLAVRVVLAA